MKRFHVILQGISNGCDINSTSFQDYALQTFRVVIRLYPWYYMSTSVHKLLIHGAQIITPSLLPIGLMRRLEQKKSKYCCHRKVKHKNG